jgi:hypothetical protein
MFDIVSGFRKPGEVKVITAGDGTIGKSRYFEINQPTLEELLMELKHYGKPRVGMFDGGWYCSIEMNTNTVGADFKCASEFDIPTPTDAAKQCLERVLKAVEQYRK